MTSVGERERLRRRWPRCREESLTKMQTIQDLTELQRCILISAVSEGLSSSRTCHNGHGVGLRPSVRVVGGKLIAGELARLGLAHMLVVRGSSDEAGGSPLASDRPRLPCTPATVASQPSAVSPGTSVEPYPVELYFNATMKGSTVSMSLLQSPTLASANTCHCCTLVPTRSVTPP
jgi:hypothetical protein